MREPNPDSPLVTVIIPTHDRLPVLGSAVQSVLQQTHQRLQVVVVDDGSPEPVLPAHLPADDRIVLLRHDTRTSPGAARNTALQHAVGEFVTFLDDDDQLTPDRIAQAIRDIGTATVHIVASNIDGRPRSGTVGELVDDGALPSLLQVMIRREATPMFDPTLRSSEDLDWWLRLPPDSDVVWSPLVGVEILGDHSPRPGLDPAIRFACRRTVALRHRHRLSRRGRAQLYRRVASAAALAGRRADTLTYAVRALASRPSRLALKLAARAVLPTHRLQRD